MSNKITNKQLFNLICKFIELFIHSYAYILFFHFLISMLLIFLWATQPIVPCALNLSALKTTLL